MIGRVLGGRYEIIQRLGSGGMSVVYKAKCSYLEREVAIKVLRERFADDEEFLSHFRREARAAARLSHPNIVNIFDVGEEPDQGLYYIIMEYISGRSLKDLITREGPLHPDTAVDITCQILKALECAHDSGVVHRDIKPDNVIIDSSGAVKVADFGIARAQGTGTVVSTDRIMGSVRYMSPEQARGRHTDARSDLYSVGVVLYEMLTGKVPFEGDSAVAIALEHMHQSPPLPSEVREDIPSGLDDVILCAMAKDPGRRYPDSDHMLQDLLLVQQGGSPKAKREEFLNDDTRIMDRVPVRSRGSKMVATKRSRRREEPRDSGDEFSEDDDQPRQRRWWLIILWLVFTMMVVGVLAYAAYWVWDWYTVPIVDVPEVVGEQLPTAEAVLEEHGLQSEIVASKHDDDIPANHVISQRPLPGEQVRRGGTIELTISQGPQWVEGGVPEVVGMPRLDAQVALQNAGLEFELSEEYHEEVPGGHVIDQFPPPGDKVQRGSVVDLQISRGPEPRPFAMQGYIGKSLPVVLSELTELGLEARVVREVADFPEEMVFDHEPEVGVEVNAGDIVTLIVSRGNERDVIEEEITVTLEETPQLQRVTVELMDSVSRRVVFDDLVEGGSEFDLTLYWYGSGARAFVYINNSAVRVITFRR